MELRTGNFSGDSRKFTDWSDTVPFVTESKIRSIFLDAVKVTLSQSTRGSTGHTKVAKAFFV